MSETTSTSKSSCHVLQAGEAFRGKQGFDYRPAISAETAGARGIHMQLLTIPPGGRAKAHKHESHETAIYCISGISGCWWGERLEHHSLIGAGAFFFIPADMPHLPYNASATEPCVADPNEQESVVLLPELDTVHA